MSRERVGSRGFGGPSSTILEGWWRGRIEREGKYCTVYILVGMLFIILSKNEPNLRS